MGVPGFCRATSGRRRRVTKMLGKYLFVIFALVLLIVGAVACSQTAKVIRRPLPDIVGQAARDGFSGLDYVVWVDCTVRNNGARGGIVVKAVLQNGGFWEKRETVQVEADTERKVTFSFPEATVLGTGLSGYRFSCSA